MMTLLQATAVSERWGTSHYGRLTGLLAAPVMISAALAPWIGSTLAAALDSYPAMVAVMAGAGLVAAGLAAHRSRPRTSPLGTSRAERPRGGAGGEGVDQFVDPVLEVVAEGADAVDVPPVRFWQGPGLQVGTRCGGQVESGFQTRRPRRPGPAALG